MGALSGWAYVARTYEHGACPSALRCIRVRASPSLSSPMSSYLDGRVKDYTQSPAVSCSIYYVARSAHRCGCTLYIRHTMHLNTHHPWRHCVLNLALNLRRSTTTTMKHRRSCLLVLLLCRRNYSLLSKRRLFGRLRPQIRRRSIRRTRQTHTRNATLQQRYCIWELRALNFQRCTSM